MQYQFEAVNTPEDAARMRGVQNEAGEDRRRLREVGGETAAAPSDQLLRRRIGRNVSVLRGEGGKLMGSCRRERSRLSQRSVSEAFQGLENHLASIHGQKSVCDIFDKRISERIWNEFGARFPFEAHTFEQIEPLAMSKQFK